MAAASIVIRMFVPPCVTREMGVQGRLADRHRGRVSLIREAQAARRLGRRVRVC